MKKYLVIIFLLFVNFLTFGQKKRANERIFCFPPFERVGVKTDQDLNDYLEFKVCNGSNLKIIGVVVGYDDFVKAQENQGKEIVRSKASILPQTKGKVKVYLPYSIYPYEIDRIEIKRFIYSDGTSYKLNLD